jgi:hypothetical protein
MSSPLGQLRILPILKMESESSSNIASQPAAEGARGDGGKYYCVMGSTEKSPSACGRAFPRALPCRWTTWRVP